MKYVDVSGFIEDLGGSSVISRVLIFDPITQTFNETYSEGQPYGQLPEAQGYGGMIVYAKQDALLDFSSSYCYRWNLKTGINLVGSSCVYDGMKAYNLLNDIGSDKVIGIQRYNSDTGNFESASYDSNLPVGVNFTIKPGEGYFIFMK